MSKTDEINKGDIVRVDFNGAQITLCHEAEVLYTPVATGDSWMFKNLTTGAIHYVSEGCTITRQKQCDLCKKPATTVRRTGIGVATLCDLHEKNHG